MEVGDGRVGNEGRLDDGRGENEGRTGRIFGKGCWVRGEWV